MGKVIIDTDKINWKRPNSFLVFLYLLANADENGKVVTTIRSLADALGLTEKQIRISLQKIEKGRLGANQRAGNNSIITISNSKSYKVFENAKGQTKGQTKGRPINEGADQRADLETAKLPLNTGEVKGSQKQKGQTKGQTSPENQPIYYNINIINKYIEDYGLRLISEIIGEERINTPKDIDIRKIKFYITLIEYVPKYGKELVRDFFEFWSEYNRSETKMKFEMQETFQIGRRLGRWKRNESEWNIKVKTNTSLAVGQARVDENAESIIKKSGL